MEHNERLRRARLARGWTQQDLADHLGIGVATVRSWERGWRTPGLLYQAQLAVLLAVSPADLGFAAPGPGSDEPGAPGVPGALGMEAVMQEHGQ
jgi:transcriptional regulator with XRE-family HTH domain